MNQFQASGVWSPREAILHINALEMLAMRNSLTAFRTQLAGLAVQLMSDEPVQSGERIASLSAGFAHFSPCQTYSRKQECVGRPALQEGQSCSHGMDTSPVCGGHDIQHMGQAQCRPIRDTPEQQATGICLSHGGSTSGGCGRHVNHMEGNVCICVPPICDARSGDRQDPTRSSV